MSSLDEQIRKRLEAWEAAGLRRTLEHIDGIDFCTNDYLGLARDPALTDAVVDAVKTWGAGSRAARLLGGHLPLHATLEHAAAQWMGVQASLLFPSGWHANVALLSTLPTADDLIVSDAHNHASLIDGMRLSRAAVRQFAHNNPAALEVALRDGAAFATRWIVVESVYSMDGSLAPLDQYAEIAARHDAHLIVDEAHAVGLYGTEGQGRCADMPQVRLAARVVTGGKALGASGALVGGSRQLIDLLLNRARPFVFTTSPPPAVVAALLASIRAMPSVGARRQRVHRNAEHLRAALRDQEFAVRGESPILFVPCRSPDAAVAAAGRIQAAGFQVRAVRPPTVPEGHSGLRVVVHADHTTETLDALAAQIGNAVAPVAQTPATATARAQPWIVIGTDTDVGKTVVSAVLARALVRAGRPMRYWKAVQTGTVLDTETVTQLAGLSAEALIPPVVQLALPASVDQAAEAEGTHIALAPILEQMQAQLAALPGVDVIVETAGGILVPFNDREDQRDLVRRLAGRVVLVARSGLGTLNHTRLTVEAMRRKGLTPHALFLVGDPHARNRKTLRTWLPGVPILDVPRFEPLSAATIDTWLNTHDVAAYLTDNPPA